jgi:hypothetical protein
VRGVRDAAVDVFSWELELLPSGVEDSVNGQ